MRVENYGITGWSTGQQLLVFRDVIATDPPSVLTLCVFQNDVKENGDACGGRRPWFHLDGESLVLENHPVATAIAVPDGRTLPRLRSVQALHLAGNRLGKALRRIRDGVLLAGEPERPHPGTIEEWRVLRELMTMLRDECGAIGTDFRVFVVTGGWEIGSNAEVRSDVDPDRAMLLRVCDELGVPVMDPTPDLRIAWASAPGRGAMGEPYYFTRDVHWTSTAAAWVGRWLARSHAWPMLESCAESAPR